MLLCIAAACMKHTVYHSFHHLSIAGWKKSDTLPFHIAVTDSNPPVLHLFADIRYRQDYPYSRLYLFIRQNLQDSSTWKTDTISLQLTDDKGRKTGNGGNAVLQLSAFVGSVRPQSSGKYVIQVVSGMKDESLTGINDIGIRVEK